MYCKVAILIPYFGTKPDWFEYFILSCQRNPHIDWFFFSDCLSTKLKSSNLKFFKMKLEDFNILATKQIGVKIAIRHPYKMCDLKPAYGLIFESFIDTYDFWGYGDIDLVYGDILGILPQNWHLEYDIISNHNEFIPGHFCILRNTEKIRNLFRVAVNFNSIFQSNLYHGFDEQIHPIKIVPNDFLLLFTKSFKIWYHLTASRIISALKNRLKLDSLKLKKSPGNKKPSTINDFTSAVKFSAKKNNLRAFFKTSFMSDLMFRQLGIMKWKIEWENGKLKEKYTDKEIMYFHMILAKKSNNFHINDIAGDIERFLITKEGIR